MFYDAPPDVAEFSVKIGRWDSESYWVSLTNNLGLYKAKVRTTLITVCLFLGPLQVGRWDKLTFIVPFNTYGVMLLTSIKFLKLFWSSHFKVFLNLTLGTCKCVRQFLSNCMRHWKMNFTKSCVTGICFKLLSLSVSVICLIFNCNLIYLLRNLKYLLEYFADNW